MKPQFLNNHAGVQSSQLDANKFDSNCKKWHIFKLKCLISVLGYGTFLVRLWIFAALARCLRASEAGLWPQRSPKDLGRVWLCQQSGSQHRQEHSALLLHRDESQLQAKPLLHSNTPFIYIFFTDLSCCCLRQHVLNIKSMATHQRPRKKIWRPTIHFSNFVGLF